MNKKVLDDTDRMYVLSMATWYINEFDAGYCREEMVNIYEHMREELFDLDSLTYDIDIETHRDEVMMLIDVAFRVANEYRDKKGLF